MDSQSSFEKSPIDDTEDISIIFKELAKTQLSSVYLAKNFRTNDIVVWKKLNNVKQFRNECKMLKKVKHSDYFVKILGEFMNKTEPVIILEYMEGPTLTHYIHKTHILPFSKVLEISLELFSAIDYLEKLSILHRDIKPDNIFTSSTNQDFTVKLGDFGLSTKYCPSKKRTGFYGTLLYMAPEVILESDHTFGMDIWSLGVTIFNLVTTKYPFSQSCNSSQQIMNNITSAAYPSKNKMISKIRKIFLMNPIQAIQSVIIVKRFYPLFEQIFTIAPQIRLTASEAIVILEGLKN